MNMKILRVAASVATAITMVSGISTIVETIEDSGFTLTMSESSESSGGTYLIKENGDIINVGIGGGVYYGTVNSSIPELVEIIRNV